jgi:hypothetical protein
VWRLFAWIDPRIPLAAAVIMVTTSVLARWRLVRH